MNLTALLGRRIGIGMIQVLGVITLIFLLTEALPGDAAVIVAGDSPDPERITRLRHAMQLDQPVVQRYLDWLDGLAHGDFGTSLISGRSVADTLMSALGPTIALAGITFFVLVPSAVMLGATAARTRGSWADRLISGVTLGLYSVPEFASGVLLIAVFALQLQILPANALGMTSPFDNPTVFVLPVLVLMIRPLCSISRLIRAGLVSADAADYVRHLRRAGLTERRIIWAHTLPTTSAPAVQQLARTVDWLLGGVIVVEAIFVLPGLGSTLVDAVAARDVPVIQGLAVFFGLTTVLVNVVADLISYRMNPRAVPQ